KYFSKGWKYFSFSGTDSDQNFYYKSDSVYIKGVERALFTSDRNCDNANTLFIDISGDSTNTIVDWFWNFDDPGSGVDNTSTMEKPEHIFASSGNYNVFMQIIDECGIIVDTTITTRIFDSNDLQPDFDHPNPICA